MGTKAKATKGGANLLKVGSKVEVEIFDSYYGGKPETYDFLGKVTKADKKSVTVSREGTDWEIPRRAITSVRRCTF